LLLYNFFCPFDEIGGRDIDQAVGIRTDVEAGTDLFAQSPHAAGKRRIADEVTGVKGQEYESILIRAREFSRETRWQRGFDSSLTSFLSRIFLAFGKEVYI